MHERVHVVARVRPFLACDPDSATLATTISDDHTHVTVHERHRFAVDHAFPMEASTEDVFAGAVRPFIDDFLAGFSVTVMAYGQTGTGKTFTMSGLIPLIVNYMMGDANHTASSDTSRYAECSDWTRSRHQSHRARTRQANMAKLHYGVDSVTLQYVEVYGDTLRDLFSDDPAQSSKELQLFDMAMPTRVEEAVCHAGVPNSISHGSSSSIVNHSRANGCGIAPRSWPYEECNRDRVNRMLPQFCNEAAHSSHALSTDTVDCLDSHGADDACAPSARNNNPESYANNRGHGNADAAAGVANTCSFSTQLTLPGVMVAGARQLHPRTVQETLEFIAYGSAVRATGFTNMSESSSRSHSILTFTHRPSGCKLNLVDLAGSERNDKTHNVGLRFKESIGINSGLLALGNVIRALHRNYHKNHHHHHHHHHHHSDCHEDEDREHKQQQQHELAMTTRSRSPASPSHNPSLSHVPYRSSKLTRLLQDALGGNSKTLFIACIAPDSYNSGETRRTLYYCALALRVINEPVAQQERLYGANQSRARSTARRDGAARRGEEDVTIRGRYMNHGNNNNNNNDAIYSHHDVFADNDRHNNISSDRYNDRQAGVHKTKSDKTSDGTHVKLEDVRCQLCHRHTSDRERVHESGAGVSEAETMRLARMRESLDEQTHMVSHLRAALEQMSDRWRACAYELQRDKEVFAQQINQMEELGEENARLQRRVSFLEGRAHVGPLHSCSVGYRGAPTQEVRSEGVQNGQSVLLSLPSTNARGPKDRTVQNFSAPKDTGDHGSVGTQIGTSREGRILPATTMNVDTNQDASHIEMSNMAVDEKENYRSTGGGSSNNNMSGGGDAMLALTRDALFYQNSNTELRNRLRSAVSLLDAQRRETALLRLELAEAQRFFHS